MKEILSAIKRVLLIVEAIFHSIILPESSLLVWIHAVGLKWWVSYLIVAPLSTSLMILIFWPKQTARILSLEKREKIEIFLRKILFSLKSWSIRSLRKVGRGIESVADSNKNNKISIGQLFLGSLILPLITLVNVVKSIKIWLKHRNHSFISWLKGLGYFGVVATAGFPGSLFPFIFGVRPTGIALVFTIGTWQAKVLFISVELIRLFLEAWFWK